jgi:Sulfotransferase family
MSSKKAPAALPWEQLGELEEYQELVAARLKHLVPVQEPLVLVSQIQRSGGTLLSQLLDGHPECHAHPPELKIGSPRKDNWPELDLGRPETWFGILFHRRAVKQLLEGYDRGSGSPDEPAGFPFLLLPGLQKAIFDACVEAEPVASERDVLDRYFTSYFNAWLDNHNLYTGPKKVVTGFTPRLAMQPGNLERFFAAYPDGTLISIVRVPGAWYESASKWRPQYYSGVEAALELWRQSTEAALEAAERFGDRVLVLTYEALIGETEATMSRVAERIGISMSPLLLRPTFNRLPIRANSSDPVGRYGILPERARAYRDSLPGETVGQIEALAGDLYERAAALAVR